MDRIKL